ncbi:SRPBCC family protein [Tahibacter amnicola]|uniref:SRPBCC family protein n=1 Tax=Tahibacter amnicola TaxID=2976241 RepID=A0ABY6BBJ6_9GAMM|nr:SRPBCC family protein [Tahibacter amnicola]UXI67244.1 SRPBCC family protein [Tahibacter amnicola]
MTCVDLVATHAFRCGPDPIFALSVDAGRFPQCFAGFGPIPAIRAIQLHGSLAAGTTRTIDNSDGSSLTETITQVTPPHEHHYTLQGFRPPFSWLVRKAQAQWCIDGSADHSAVTWRYRFELTSPLAFPIAAPLLRVFMAGAMRRCLQRMAQLLQA